MPLCVVGVADVVYHEALLATSAPPLIASPAAFVERLRCFDASSAESRARIERARPLLEGPHMATEAVRKKSNAAAGLVARAE